MGTETHELRLRLATAIIALIGALLTLAVAFSVAIVRGCNAGSQVEKSTVAGCASDDRNFVRTLQDVLDDIDSRPLAQQAITARQYAGLRITREPLWLHNITEESDNKTFHLTLLTGADQHGPDLPRGRVVCAVERSSYPALIGARKGLKLYVSVTIREFKDRQIELTCVSLAFSAGIT